MFKKRSSSTLSYQITMFSHYTKIGFRHLIKNKQYSTINIAGLTIGMTCFMMIALFIHYELSFDTQHEHPDRIYRVCQYQEGNDINGKDRLAIVPSILAPTIQTNLPDVEAATTTVFRFMLFSHEDIVAYEQGLMADEQFFDVFSFELLEGNGKEALVDPSSILITESMAQKFFGDDSPMNQTISFGIGQSPLTVRGILKDPPPNQHLSFDYITSIQNYPGLTEDEGRWNHTNYYAYIMLQEGVDYKQWEKSLSIIDEMAVSAYEQFSFTPEYYLQPILDIHLHSDLVGERSSNGDIRYIYLFASIGLIILFLASANYINLAIAHTVERAKEIGMRKVIGAKNNQIIHQLLGESFLITLLSFLLALLLAYIITPFLSQLLDQPIPFSFRDLPLLLIGMFSVAFFICGFSGLYPAWYLSSQSILKSLKATFSMANRRNAIIRNALVVGQFSVAIMAAVGSLVIYQQLQFIQQKKLGFNKDQVVYVNYGYNSFIFKKEQFLKESLLANPHIQKVSFSGDVPLNVTSNTIINEWEGNHEENPLYISRIFVDHDFMNLFEFELLDGRFFDPSFPTDTTQSIIINETAMKAIGWESAIGKSFGGRGVIGVVRDFHFQPFQREIAPLYLQLRNKDNIYGGVIAMKIDTEQMTQTLSFIDQMLKEIAPQVPLSYRFMDQDYLKMYQAEQRINYAFNIFTLVALFIACMGLFGLVAFKVAQRTKEIGIRKVLGANIEHIVGLISKDFMGLILIANIIAFPLAYWAMNQWLEDFAYRIDINWVIFFIAGGSAIAISFLTISSQSVKAALANPVDSLRDE